MRVGGEHGAMVAPTALPTQFIRHGSSVSHGAVRRVRYSVHYMLIMKS